MPAPDAIDELLHSVLEQPETTWRPGLEALCARHSGRAAELRRRFDVLCSLGLHREDDTSHDEATPPERLGDFRLLERLGQGGMGVVHAARQESLGRTVALKLVRPEQLYFAGARERFRREIAAVAQLSHPGIVSVFAVGEERGVPYLAMELLRGAGLDDVVRALSGRRSEELTGADLARAVGGIAGESVEALREPFTCGWNAACTAIVRDVARAVAHAHEHGIVHRDIKPSNVMVTLEGRVVLLDFGLAHPAGVDRMTRDGANVGSLPYMAPEQVLGEAGDARTDVYGLGVLLREILTLRQPFLTDSREATRQRILHGEGRPLAADNHTVSWELATVCAQATDPEPRRRYGSAADLAKDLDCVLAKRPIAARPTRAARRIVRWAQRRPALATGLVLGALVAVGTPAAIAVGIAGQRDRARAAEAAQEQKAFEASLAAAWAALQIHDVGEARARLAACPPALRGFEWRHISLAVDGSLVALDGHAAPVRAVAMSADASLLASGGEDGRVRLFDVRGGRTLDELALHRESVELLAFSADGKRLLSHDASGRTCVVDLATKALVGERERASAQEALAIASDAGAVLVSLGGWRILELDPERLLPRREIALERVGKAPQSHMVTDGHLLAAVSVSELDVWDLATGRLCLRLPDVVSSTSTLVVAPAGDRVALADTHGRLVVCAVPGGQVLQIVSDQRTTRGLAFDRSGRYLAAGGSDGAVRCWEVTTGRLVGMYPGHAGAIHGVAFAGARMLIATAGEDRSVRLWSPFGSRDHQVLRGHVGVVTKLAVTAAGDRLLSASQDGSVRVWDSGTGLPVSARNDYPHHVNALAVTGDGRTVFASFHGAVVATDLVDPALSRSWSTGRGCWVRDLATAGDTLLLADQDGCALLDPRGVAPARPLAGLQGRASSCVLGKGGLVAWAGGGDGTVVRWSLPAAGAGSVVGKEAGAIVGLALGRDGQDLFVLCGDTLRCRDAATFALRWQRARSSRPLAVAVLGTGERVVTGHGDGSLVIWDSRLGEPLLTRKLSEFAVRAVACDAAGTYVAAGCADGICHVLRAATTLTPERLLETAGIRAAIALHAEQRDALRTREEVLAAILARPDLDPELRGWMQACERAWLVMPWSTVVAAEQVVLQPGLAPERYVAARRVAEAYLRSVNERLLLAVAVVTLASVRLGEHDRALEAAATMTEAELQTGDSTESTLCAGRALASHARGKRDQAAADLARLVELASKPDAEPETVSLWREVEAALAR